MKASQALLCFRNAEWGRDKDPVIHTEVRHFVEQSKPIWQVAAWRGIPTLEKCPLDSEVEDVKDLPNVVSNDQSLFGFGPELLANRHTDIKKEVWVAAAGTLREALCAARTAAQPVAADETLAGPDSRKRWVGLLIAGSPWASHG